MFRILSTVATVVAVHILARRGVASLGVLSDYAVKRLVAKVASSNKGK